MLRAKGAESALALRQEWVRRAESLEKSEEEGQSGRRWGGELTSCRISFGWSQDFAFHSEWDGKQFGVGMGGVLSRGVM